MCPAFVGRYSMHAILVYYITCEKAQEQQFVVRMLRHMQLYLSPHEHAVTFQVKSTIVTIVVLHCIMFYSTLMQNSAEQRHTVQQKLNLKQSNSNGLHQL